MRYKVDKVVEDLLGVADSVHVGEETETRAQGQGINGHASTICAGEDGRGISLDSETVDGSCGDVEIGVCGAEDEEENAGV